MSKITPLYGDDAIERFKQLTEEAKSPTPSKEPSVDEIDDIIGTIQFAARQFPTAKWTKFNKQAKAQLLALHLGCLPGKMAVPINVRSFNNGMSGVTTNPYKEGEIKGHNSAVDLMEQKLREMYGV